MTKKAPFVVGLTGGIGSGKSAVADLFASHGVPVVDTDQIARDLTVAGGAAMADIVAAFGPQFALADGSLDRAAMRARVFGDEAERQRLNAILHPRINAESRRQIAASCGPYVLLVVPLLFETGGYADLCQRTLAVDCPEWMQVARVTARSGLAADQVRAIMTAQMPRDARLAQADDIVDNSGSLSSLALAVAEKHHDYLTLAAA
ncbi:MULTISPECIES: dephospho-CoA kinase [Microvirgula]|uniref:Dephospho-CoA kinase n=1 Tax=Microvirgula aerodenitrificans TaxID=57480 RepID=A0A2S0PAJ3_9NEIS|nr:MULTISPECIES: dephospho-CoA kinase [Microvirgula]AVY94398.1 dephospho-CoA kinase [Microvirgula aerodenitrificans]RAS19185.1 dephospho-CoA kinase [Microvirgula sp. AG722]